MAAAVGLAAAGFALRQWGLEFLGRNLGRLPFWFDVGLPPATVLYAGGLTVLGAAIAGVMPALKVTRGLGSRLREGTAGGGGLRFGGVWTAVIVTQVAVTVAFPAVVYHLQRDLLRIRSSDAGFPAEEYLAVQLEMDAATVRGADDEATRAAQRESFTAALETLRHRVAAEPGVAGVTFVDRLPRLNHPDREIELDDASVAPAQDGGAASTAGPPPLREVDIASIDPSYFAVLETPMLAGRAFHAGDLAPDARAVIVDQGFVDQVLLGRNAIGLRVRFAEIPQPHGRTDVVSRPWYEIVGVVKELGMGGAGFYLPAAPGSAGPLNMLVHVQGDPMSLGPQVRAIATAVDPTLRLSNFQRLDEVTNGSLWITGLWLRITLLLTGIALLLSFAGIYAVLSFTVARRTREIGVRVALGASRRRVVAALFRRPLTQVGLGVVAGGALIAAGALLLSRAPTHGAPMRR